jgi:signal transduction histidine kinase
MNVFNAKKQYVRYISNELRTPINAAFLGLQLVSDDLKNSDVPRDRRRHDDLSDVQVSCSVALGILDDMVTFEKLESGILELHKQDVDVVSFLSECVGTFSAQSRAARVTLSLLKEEAGMGSGVPHPSDSCVGGGDPSDTIAVDANGAVDNDAPRRICSIPINENDSVLMDKSKMAQVVRNLISNALKFTPAGGTVSVIASFVPTMEGFEGHSTSKKRSVLGMNVAKSTAAGEYLTILACVCSEIYESLRPYSLSCDTTSTNQTQMNREP